MDAAKIYDEVREHYSAASKGISSEYSEAIAKSFGYSEAELSSIPEGANLGLSCGNPLAITSLREGETVIDLGSGAGFDVFLASSKIGPSGRAIGVDMNDVSFCLFFLWFHKRETDQRSTTGKDMLARANNNKASRDDAASNVTFVKGVITDIPLEDGTGDCIISNCVINLVPAAEKPQVFKEMHRLLKSGGRVAVSDILAKKELPGWLRSNMAMYVGCIAGTSQVAEYEQWLRDAGFRDILITDAHADLNVYLNTAADGSNKAAECCAPSSAMQSNFVSVGNSCCDTSKQPQRSVPAESQGGDTCRPADNGAGTVVDIKDVNLNEWVGKCR